MPKPCNVTSNTAADEVGFYIVDPKTGQLQGQLSEDGETLHPFPASELKNKIKFKRAKKKKIDQDVATRHTKPIKKLSTK